MNIRRTLATGFICTAVAAGLLAGGPGSASAAPQAAHAGRPPAGAGISQEEVPAAIRLPDGFVVKKAERMRGVQVYTCTNGTWTFTEPRAQGRTLTHSRGPIWQSRIDESLVGAARIAGAPGGAGNVEWLLLQANRNEGSGELSDVRFVQRLATRGGTPESARFPACTAELQGQVRQARYQATYTFAAAV